MLERRAIIARRLVQAARTVVTSGLPILLSHEAAEWKKIRQREGEFAAAGSIHRGAFLERRGLVALLHDQDHTGSQRGDVLIVAFEGSHGCLVSGGNRIKGFAGLDFVAQNAGLV